MSLGALPDPAGELPRGVVQVQLLTARRVDEADVGTVTVATIDSEQALVLAFAATGGPPTASAVPVGGVVNALVAAFPAAPHAAHAWGDQGEIVVPVEFTAGFSRAVRTGDRAAIEAVLEACGWSGVPPLLHALATEVQGSAQVVIRTGGLTNFAVASYLLVPDGWVELALGPDDTMRHLPRSLEDIRAGLVSGLAAAFDRAQEDRP